MAGAPRELSWLPRICGARIRSGEVLAIVGGNLSGSFWLPTSGPGKRQLIHLILGWWPAKARE